jgi:hypothetical protein
MPKQTSTSLAAIAGLALIFAGTAEPASAIDRKDEPENQRRITERLQRERQDRDAQEAAKRDAEQAPQGQRQEPTDSSRVFEEVIRQLLSPR